MPYQSIQSVDQGRRVADTQDVDAALADEPSDAHQQGRRAELLPEREHRRLVEDEAALRRQLDLAEEGPGAGQVDQRNLHLLGRQMADGKLWMPGRMDPLRRP
ncbi:MAG: hypothetical protein V2A66_02625 [Pseudomonadota bacterium]